MTNTEEMFSGPADVFFFSHFDLCNHQLQGFPYFDVEISFAERQGTKSVQLPLQIKLLFCYGHNSV